MKRRVYLLVAAFVLGAAAGAAAHALFAPAPSSAKPLRESDLNPAAGYRFTDPLIGAGGVGQGDTTRALKSSISSFIASEETKGNLATASVFFNDYSQSAGFTLNPTEQYNPASLFKVPTMIAYYKLAERNPSILQQRLIYSGAQDFNLQENIKSPVQLVPGISYSVSELIGHMIKYSDNNAAEMLVQNLNATGGQNTFENLFRDLGITNIDINNDYITIGGYSLFFRVLYNATYLSRDDSEAALKLLSETDFTKGISAGVPHNTEVSEKFGEFTLQTSAGVVLKRELHNCGIVYYPGHSYLLCVMTKGSDFSKLEEIIAQISRQAYTYMETKYPDAQSK